MGPPVLSLRVTPVSCTFYIEMFCIYISIYIHEISQSIPFVDYQQLQSTMEATSSSSGRVLMAVEMSDPRDNMHAGHLGMYNVASTGELVDMQAMSRSPSQNMTAPTSPILPSSSILSRHIAK